MIHTFRVLYADEKDTMELAQSLAPLLRAGDFLAMFGDMGAGKTTFLRSLAAALGIDDVISPTFTIVREHTDGALPFFHFDAYRLADSDELYAIGYADYLARGGIVAMEWCENVPEALPKERMEIELRGSGDETRSITLRAYGEHYTHILEELLCPAS